jgi:thioester reductase-like protein
MLGLNETDLNRIKNEVNVIIHSAASVYFHLHIHDILRLNYFASQQLMEIAKSSSNV